VTPANSARLLSCQASAIVNEAAACEGSPQLIEERLGILQDGRVEAFGEPPVDRREEITGLDELALVAPKAGEGSGCANL
jgi:hypothetical protein